jgi:hypothetical protein
LNLCESGSRESADKDYLFRFQNHLIFILSPNRRAEAKKTREAAGLVEHGGDASLFVKGEGEGEDSLPFGF